MNKNAHPLSTTVFALAVCASTALAQTGSRDSIANFGRGHWNVYDDGIYLVCPGKVDRQGNCFGHTPFPNDEVDHPLPWVTLQEALDIRLSEPAAVVQLTVRGELLSVKYRRAAELYRRPAPVEQETRGPYYLAVPKPLEW